MTKNGYYAIYHSGLVQLCRSIFFKALGNLNVNYLKFPKKHRGPHKRASRARCGPRVWDPWYKTTWLLRNTL